VASTHAGIALNLSSGAVTVAGGTPVGTHTLTYRICEIAMPSNCDEAVATVTVLPTPITAGADYARASSRLANTAIANVLANDRLGSAPATLANLTLSFVSLTPANSKIRLDLTDGSVDVLGKTESGLYLLVYEICEIAMPTKCARATVRLDLTGSLTTTADRGIARIQSTADSTDNTSFCVVRVMSVTTSSYKSSTETPRQLCFSVLLLRVSNCSLTSRVNARSRSRESSPVFASFFWHPDCETSAGHVRSDAYN
jgi:hypothetical protein